MLLLSLSRPGRRTGRQYATVQKSKQIVLSDVPFQPGQRVEVVVLAEEERPVNPVRELREVVSSPSSASVIPRVESLRH